LLGLLGCCSGKQLAEEMNSGALHLSFAAAPFTKREFVIADDRELKSTTDIGVIARGTVLAGPSTHIAQSPATMHLDAVNSTIDPVSVRLLWRWQHQWLLRRWLSC